MKQIPNGTRSQPPRADYHIEGNRRKRIFDLSGYKKDNMINGFDDIDYLQNIKEEVVAFANHHTNKKISSY
jgi:3-isopropylmalate dehydratase small subunit